MVDFEKVREEASLHIKSLFPLDRRRRGIVCPICGNGQGKDGDGLNFVSATSPVLKCFRCDFSGDVISLTAKANRISYHAAAELLAEKLGIKEDEKYRYDGKKRIEKFDVPKVEKAEEKFSEEKIDQTEYFQKVEKYLKETDYPKRRGLSEETSKKFHLGFDAIWKHPKVSKSLLSPRLIVPTSPYSYLARDVRVNLTPSQKRFSKQKFGAISLFNLEALDYEYSFITEGEIDAMSFYEVGRVNALALGSVSNIQKLADHLKKSEKKPKYVTAALDNDAAGLEGNLKLKKLLAEIGVHVLVADFLYKDLAEFAQYKDANEMLVKNRPAFIENIKLVWKLGDEDYETDKLGSQLLAEKGLLPSRKYADDELREAVGLPATKKSPFVFTWKYFRECQKKEYPEIAKEVDADPDFSEGRFPSEKLPEKKAQEIEYAEKVLTFFSDLGTVDVLYHAAVLRAMAISKLYVPEKWESILAKLPPHFEGSVTFVEEQVNEFARDVIKEGRIREKANFSGKPA